MKIKLTMRELHRYLGFFLAGIMFVYAVSGIVLIFRDRDTFKKSRVIEKQLEKNLSSEKLSKVLGIKKFKVLEENVGKIYFKEGEYILKTGTVKYIEKKLPYLLNKMTHLHKAKSSDSLYFLNIFFGLSLLFFVISSFWMFLPTSPLFKKGLYFTVVGIVFALILLFV